MTAATNGGRQTGRPGKPLGRIRAVGRAQRARREHRGRTEMSRSSSTLALIAVIAASVFGYILATMIPDAVFPEITFRRATILADSGDLPAEQMLASVTRPLEETAYSVVGVTMVRSTTTRGSSEVDVTFCEDADPVTSFEMLSAAVAHTRSELPADTQVDAVLLTTRTFPIIATSI